MLCNLLCNLSGESSTMRSLDVMRIEGQFGQVLWVKQIKLRLMLCDGCKLSSDLFKIHSLVNRVRAA